MSKVGWFFALYYPLLLLILWNGYRVPKSERNELLLDCAFLGVIGGPFLYAIGHVTYLVLVQYR
jgi:hypothetical protein